MGITIRSVTEIRQHPGENAENLTLVRLHGVEDELVANKLEDDSFRYAPGDLVQHIAVNTILPDDLLRMLDLWQDKGEGKGKGTLKGNKGNRMGSRTIAGTESLGMMIAVENKLDGLVITHPNSDRLVVRPGDDVSAFYGTSEYVPA